MREAAALVRAQWLAAISYRMGMAMSVASLAAIVVPVYFVANALQPVMQDSIRSQGGDYFAFVVVGIMAVQLVAVSLNALPNAIQSGIGTGTLEALLSTRVRLPVLLGGVYYPTQVIPSWIQYISHALPLTYGLRAIRGTLLEGMPFHQVLGDVVILAGFTLGLALLSAWLFALALRYARRAGTLAQY